MSYTWKRGLSEPGGGGESYEWTETWIVLGYEQTDSTVGWLALLEDRPDLQKGRQHPLVPAAYVDDFQADRIDTSDAWEAKVRFKIVAEERPDVSPLEKPAEVEIDSESEPVPCTRWNDNRPILNTAKDLIVGEVRDDPRVLLNVTKYVERTPTWVFAYAGAINDDTVVIDGETFGPRTLRCKQIRRGKRESEVVNNATVYFYTLTFSLIHNPDTWIRRPLNRGLYELYQVSNSSSSSDAGQLRKRRITLDGEPVEEPQFLDDQGFVLEMPVDPDEVTWVEGYVDRELPFSALPLT